MSLPRLFGVAVAVATVIGGVSTLLIRVTTGWLGAPTPWPQAASGWVDWYIWAALTPVVVGLARVFPVREQEWVRGVARHGLLALLVGVVELALFASVMSYYYGVVMGVELAPFTDRYVALIGRWLPVQMLIYALIVAMVTAVENGRRARVREVRAARLETELSRAQLHALQAQVQPHFLFNTMNTISMAVREERNHEAVTMMAHLSGLLRRSIVAAVRPETTLMREVAFTRHYLRLERYRMEDRLEVEWEMDAQVLDARVPTMLLQPLVENAVRHGLSDLPEGGRVAVRAFADSGSLHLVVEDDGRGLRPDSGEGTGIQNVRRRLAARYGDRASLTLIPGDGGGTVARILLPLEVDALPTDSEAPAGTDR